MVRAVRIGAKSSLPLRAPGNSAACFLPTSFSVTESRRLRPLQAVPGTNHILVIVEFPRSPVRLRQVPTFGMTGDMLPLVTYLLDSPTSIKKAVRP